MKNLLEIEDLKVTAGGKQILTGVNLKLGPGQVHAIMGPNGSGKSTLAHAIMGHPKFVVDSGRILYAGEDLAPLKPDERARKGIFLGFQYPTAIPGVSVSNFLRSAAKALSGKEIAVKEFRQALKERMKTLDIADSFLSRYVNDNFSGGEKKRLEILQMLMLQPRLAVLDETDSGLDIDALKTVAAGIEKFRGPEVGILLITHYQRLLNYVKPDRVHVLVGGKLVRSGGPELALELESKGYEPFEKEAA
jgi:Fe-S cluster assembly ATP-binding protein